MENKTKHTPGPWTYHKGETGYFPTVTIPWEHPELYPGVEDHITVNAGNGPHERHEANAALIAAAPDLLAALERIKSALEDGSVVLDQTAIEDMHSIARAAIAKAKGVK